MTEMLRQKEVVTTVLEMSPDFAKELAIMLLQNEGTVISWEREDSMFDRRQTLELLLPKGIKLTIERESC